MLKQAMDDMKFNSICRFISVIQNQLRHKELDPKIEMCSVNAWILKKFTGWSQV